MWEFVNMKESLARYDGYENFGTYDNKLGFTIEGDRI